MQNEEKTNNHKLCFISITLFYLSHHANLQKFPSN